MVSSTSVQCLCNSFFHYCLSSVNALSIFFRKRSWLCSFPSNRATFHLMFRHGPSRLFSPNLSFDLSLALCSRPLDSSDRLWFCTDRFPPRKLCGELNLFTSSFNDYFSRSQTGCHPAMTRLLLFLFCLSTPSLNLHFLDNDHPWTKTFLYCNYSP